MQRIYKLSFFAKNFKANIKQNIITMKVPIEILNNWKINIDSGDKGKLAIYANVSRPMITYAFNGEASEELIKKINQFIKEKNIRIKESFKSK